MVINVASINIWSSVWKGVSFDFLILVPPLKTLSNAIIINRHNGIVSAPYKFLEDLHRYLMALEFVYAKCIWALIDANRIIWNVGITFLEPKTCFRDVGDDHRERGSAMISSARSHCASHRQKTFLQSRAHYLSQLFLVWLDLSWLLHVTSEWSCSFSARSDLSWGIFVHYSLIATFFFQDWASKKNVQLQSWASKTQHKLSEPEDVQTWKIRFLTTSFEGDQRPLDYWPSTAKCESLCVLDQMQKKTGGVGVTRYSCLLKKIEYLASSPKGTIVCENGEYGKTVFCRWERRQVFWIWRANHNIRVTPEPFCWADAFGWHHGQHALTAFVTTDDQRRRRKRRQPTQWRFGIFSIFCVQYCRIL